VIPFIDNRQNYQAPNISQEDPLFYPASRQNSRKLLNPTQQQASQAADEESKLPDHS
jgi:hypothetical protein